VQPDSLGLPGDNLNLYAVLQIFQESPTLEEFEKELNSEDAHINNLDLDGDRKIDYIRVIDHVANNVHTIVLQVSVSLTETQDVAVIEVTQTTENRVYVQVIGDEALYGKNYIIEPNYDPVVEQAEGNTPNPAYVATKSDQDLRFDGEPVAVYRTSTYEVARWPIVAYVFQPGYRPWYSPYYYSYYPPAWRPWQPDYWHYYWGYHYPQHSYYFGHYRRWHDYHNPPGYTHYVNTWRAKSPYVADRERKGIYRPAYSRPDLRKEGREKYDRLHPAKPLTPRKAESTGPGKSRESIPPVSNTRRRGDVRVPDAKSTQPRGSIPPGTKPTKPKETTPTPGTVRNPGERVPDTKPKETTAPVPDQTRPRETTPTPGTVRKPGERVPDTKPKETTTPPPDKSRETTAPVTNPTRPGGQSTGTTPSQEPKGSTPTGTRPSTGDRSKTPSPPQTPEAGKQGETQRPTR
jgi:hypothetical protein